MMIHPLKAMIYGGEGSTLDFKKTISSAQKIAKSLVAFANCRGGSLLIGVNDSGTITGAAVSEEAYMIESAANFFCRPVVTYQLHEHAYNGLAVLEVQVPESNHKPHAALDEDDKWWVYIRVNDKTVLASKVVVEVLRKEHKADGAYIEYSSKEAALLEFLNANERITLNEYCRMLNLSRRRAMRILVELIHAGIIRVHTTEKVEFYTLS